jgi:hypothetical protein
LRIEEPGSGKPLYQCRREVRERCVLSGTLLSLRGVCAIHAAMFERRVRGTSATTLAEILGEVAGKQPQRF